MTNKEKILLATLELASEKGLGTVSLSQIAKKVGIQKASLYNHFSSKDELIGELYEYLREQAKRKTHVENTDYGELVKGKSASEVLHMVVKSYEAMNREPNMSMFYKVIMSECIRNPEAAQIMVTETEKMILATKQLFYAMQIHQVMSFADIDMAAFSFAMAIHSIINYGIDKEVAKDGDLGNLLEEYIEDFCKVYDTKNRTNSSE